MKNICPSTRALLDELTKDRPNLAVVREHSKELGLSFDGDLTKIMATLLRQLNDVKVKTPKKEVEHS